MMVEFNTRILDWNLQGYIAGIDRVKAEECVRVVKTWLEVRGILLIIEIYAKNGDFASMGVVSFFQLSRDQLSKIVDFDIVFIERKK